MQSPSRGTPTHSPASIPANLSSRQSSLVGLATQIASWKHCPLHENSPHSHSYVTMVPSVARLL
ncbi:hypothetical protein MHBO_002254 [Bonamia ostreae]|uniref:Uncharacterized protein n=1 Tax=Bonamia ostreae TaxID=126728 RepID=A0ABV2AMR5_9EUKA